MIGKVTVTLTEDDAARLEQAYKAGKLKDLGIESIDFSPEPNRPWADPSLEKRGKLKGKDTGPKLP
jgi:hypothetical protein